MENPFFPKELLAINWAIKPAPTDEFMSEEFLREHSASSKILNDTFTQVWSSDSDDGKKERKKRADPNKPKRKKTFDSRLWNSYKPFTAYYKTSQLTAAQQEVYLQLMKKFTNNHSPFLSKADQQDLQLYQMLQQTVATEQMEYLEFLRGFAISNQSRYSSINPHIKKYIDELWASQLKRVSSYPQFYRAHRTVALVLGSSKEGFDLIPGDVILEMGKLFRIDLDRKKLRIQVEYSAFTLKHPIIDVGSKSNESPAIIKCPVSQDQNAEAIARDMNIDFILSSSGLKRICDNHPQFNKSWELPVTVKEIEIKENGHLVKKRVIFIDKALPRRRLTNVDRIFWFYKIAVKHHLVKPPSNARNVITVDRDKHMHPKKAHESDDCFLEDMGSVNDHESFGLEGPVNAESKFEKQASIESNSSKNAESEDSASDSTIDSDSGKLGEHSDVASCTKSDSDDENLVIDDPEMSIDTKNLKGCPNDSNMSRKESIAKVAAVSSGTCKNEITSEDQSKPVTRHMAKMLENLNKVQEMVCKKRRNMDENLPGLKNLKLCSLENSDVISCKKSCAPSEISDELYGDVTIGGDSGDSKITKPKLSMLDKLLLGKEGVSNKKQQKPKKSGIKNIMKPAKSAFLPNLEPLPPPVNGNFVYRLFSLQKKDSMASGFRLLIRHKLDAQEYIHKPKPKSRIAVIVPKLEFQPEFGAEAVTVSELTQQWLSVHIRPNSFLVRARINAFTSDIMMIEEKEQRDFYREEKYLNIQASSCLNTLYAVLNGVADLPPGQYILSHDPKMGAFASLQCATNEKRNGLYDLYKQYDVDPKMEEPQILSNIWIPIDFSIITPLLDMWNRVPGTFNPRSNKVLRKKKKNKSKNH